MVAGDVDVDDISIDVRDVLDAEDVFGTAGNMVPVDVMVSEDVSAVNGVTAFEDILAAVEDLGDMVKII